MIFNPFWITLIELLVVPGTSSTSPVSAPDLVDEYLFREGCTVNSLGSVCNEPRTLLVLLLLSPQPTCFSHSSFEDIHEQLSLPVGPWMIQWCPYMINCLLPKISKSVGLNGLALFGSPNLENSSLSNLMVLFAVALPHFINSGHFEKLSSTTR